MKVFFDTSVLVAALTRAHPHHARALVWVEACGESEAGADLLVTFNAEDFERLAAAARLPIVVPPDPPRIALP